MPGASTSAENVAQLASFKSAVGTPAAAAAAKLDGVSSPATTCAPPAISALAVAMPDAPSPNTATGFPANVVMRIMGANLTLFASIAVR